MDLMNCIATDTMSMQRSRAARARLLGSTYASLPVNSVALSMAGANWLGAPVMSDGDARGVDGAIATIVETVKPWTATTTCTRFCTHRQRLKEHLFV